jgi:hypothetical protein
MILLNVIHLLIQILSAANQVPVVIDRIQQLLVVPVGAQQAVVKLLLLLVQVRQLGLLWPHELLWHKWLPLAGLAKRLLCQLWQLRQLFDHGLVVQARRFHDVFSADRLDELRLVGRRRHGGSQRRLRDTHPLLSRPSHFDALACRRSRCRTLAQEDSLRLLQVYLMLKASF